MVRGRKPSPCSHLCKNECLGYRTITTLSPPSPQVYVAAFAVSAYASSYYRAGSKPFNPVLGETYECIREDKGFRYFSEQVVTHPLVCCVHPVVLCAPLVLEEPLMPPVTGAFEMFVFRLSPASKQLR
ncbi:hypothetical protein QTO34_004398 [Cnephaeus nilssonii]|uniref:Uncharacterized protein n=1 Tax=Cnephaeus nilssonii TaxID=3371016 RepID=A0AA40LKB2_CNENI|nr:hypothetical protein QTO34_004398 [Eptesicus nilssonii]